jgi:hypothetical protein
LFDDDHHHDAHDDEHAHGHDTNIRAAYLHVLADALTSVFAIAALLGGRSSIGFGSTRSWASSARSSLRIGPAV